MKHAHQAEDGTTRVELPFFPFSLGFPSLSWLFGVVGTLLSANPLARRSSFFQYTREWFPEDAYLQAFFPPLVFRPFRPYRVRGSENRDSPTPQDTYVNHYSPLSQSRFPAISYTLNSLTFPGCVPFHSH